MRQVVLLSPQMGKLKLSKFFVQGHEASKKGRLVQSQVESLRITKHKPRLLSTVSQVSRSQTGGWRMAKNPTTPHSGALHPARPTSDMSRGQNSSYVLGPFMASCCQASAFGTTWLWGLCVVSGRLHPLHYHTPVLPRCHRTEV